MRIIGDFIEPSFLLLLIFLEAFFAAMGVLSKTSLRLADRKAQVPADRVSTAAKITRQFVRKQARGEFASGLGKSGVITWDGPFSARFHQSGRFHSIIG